MPCSSAAGRYRRPGRRYLPPTERGGRPTDEVAVVSGDARSTNVQEKPK